MSFEIDRRLSILRKFSLFFILLTVIFVFVTILLTNMLLERNEELKKSKARNERLFKNLRLESLRKNKQNIDNNFSILELADDLLKRADKKEKVYYHNYIGMSLSHLGDYDGAVNEFGKAYEIDSLNLVALIGLNYNSGKVYKFNDSFEFAKKIEKLEPNFYFPHFAIGMHFATIGKYEEAEAAINHAIKIFTIRGLEWYQDFLSPDIIKATGQSIVFVTDDELYDVLFFEKANIRAYAGKKDFINILKERTKQPISPDAVLYAINWAWLQQRHPRGENDYGALVSQASLWDLAGYTDWAEIYYTRFLEEHEIKEDRRYNELAEFVIDSLRSISIFESIVEIPVDTLFKVQSYRFNANKYYRLAYFYYYNRNDLTKYENFNQSFQKESLKFKELDSLIRHSYFRRNE
jgi:hypothetical protein